MSFEVGATPAVSVVLPTIGRESLRRAVCSALGQADIRPEVIVVVSNPDANTSVRQMLWGADCTILGTDRRLTGSQARNVGLDRAQGRYVAYLDDDDWWEPHKLRSQLAAAESLRCSHPHVVVSCQYFFHTRDDRLRVLPTRHKRSSESPAEYLLVRRRVRYGEGVIATPTLLLDSDLARQSRWDERFKRHQDWDLTLRLLSRDDVGFKMINEPLAHVQQDSIGSVSRSPDWAASLDWLAAHEDHVVGRASADFVASIVLRTALEARSWRGVSAATGRLHGRPHLAALMVGIGAPVAGSVRRRSARRFRAGRTPA